MMETAGIWMLAAVGVTLVATGLPAWIVLIGVTLAFAVGGIAASALGLPLLTAMPVRIVGLLEHDLLQALPLYVLMGALLNHLPLAQTLLRVGNRVLAPSGAGTPLAGLGLGVLLAPMNGSVGASVAMLSRTLQPRLDASGVPPERTAALVCIASTLGVVIPPSLVLVLLGDAMMRAHTEAVNITRASVRIINTQDVFAGALVPAGILLLFCVGVTWWDGRGNRSGVVPAAKPARGEWAVALVTTLFITGLLAAVTLGYLYAVEAAATGGVALFAYGLATRTLTQEVLGDVLRETMAITGALFALLVAATMFTLVVRGFGTDRWVASALGHLPGGAMAALVIVLAILALCALVLDAFEIIFVVVPVVMPPLLTVVPDATRVAVLTLLILQASFLMPPFGYAVLLVRNTSRRSLPMRGLVRSLLPYLGAQLLVLLLVLALPALVWQRNPTTLGPATAAPAGDGADAPTLEQQLERLQQESEQR